MGVGVEALGEAEGDVYRVDLGLLVQAANNVAHGAGDEGAAVEAGGVVDDRNRQFVFGARTRVMISLLTKSLAWGS